MDFSIPETNALAPVPGPGAIIKVGQARAYVAAYKKRIEELNKAFDQLPREYPRPFNPNDERLGWVFSREVIELCLKQMPEDARYVALVFGVGPREIDQAGQAIEKSPHVVHAMMTEAKAVDNNQYELPAMHPSKRDEDDFGAEQGGTCCQGG